MKGKKEQKEPTAKVKRLQGEAFAACPRWPGGSLCKRAGRIGDNDRAFEWLDKAYDERSSWLIYMNAGPAYDTVRADPRFAALLKRVGLD